MLSSSQANPARLWCLFRPYRWPLVQDKHRHQLSEERRKHILCVLDLIEEVRTLRALFRAWSQIGYVITTPAIRFWRVPHRALVQVQDCNAHTIADPRWDQCIITWGKSIWFISSGNTSSVESCYSTSILTLNPCCETDARAPWTALLPFFEYCYQLNYHSTFY